MSGTFFERLVEKLEAEYAAGTDSLNLEDTATSIATDEEKEELPGTLWDLKADMLLYFQWYGGAPISSSTGVHLLRLGNAHGYIITYPDADMQVPATAWTRVAECNNPKVVAEALKRTLLEEDFPIGTLPTEINIGSPELVDRDALVEILIGVADGTPSFQGYGFTWEQLADQVGAPEEAQAAMKARFGEDAKSWEHEVILTAADKRWVVDQYLEGAYHERS